MRRRSPREHREAGAAVVEFVALGVLLLLPLVYLIAVLGRIQAATFAVDAATRDAARAYAAAPEPTLGRRRALAAVRVALLDQGFDLSPEQVTSVRCSEPACLVPGGTITVAVELPVVLPWVPAAVDRAVPSRVTVRSSRTAAVGSFTVVTGTPGS